MDRIELAERRYRQIVPHPVADRELLPVRELVVWLEDDVAPLIPEYARRPKFQEVAVWPLRAFRRGSDTLARRQVDAVSKALTHHARLLRTALGSRTVTNAIRAGRPSRRISEEEVVIGEGAPRTVRRTVREVDRVAEMAVQIAAIAEPFWSDLVDPADYLEPRGRWPLRTPATSQVTAGELVVSLNPELHPIGDFVTRCLLRRVEVLAKVLDEADRAVFSAAGPLSRPGPKSVPALAEGAALYRQTVRQLHAVCQADGEATVRDSCVILTQVYAAFHPVADLTWLGLDPASNDVGRATLRHRFESQRNLELPERVATALGDLRRLYADEPPGVAVLEGVVARGGLVLMTSPRDVYWEGCRISSDWGRHPRPWELLVHLARRGRLGADVEERDLFEGVPSQAAMHNLFRRLKRLLPATLWKRIVPGRPPRSYRLEVDPAQIIVLDRPA